MDLSCQATLTKVQFRLHLSSSEASDTWTLWGQFRTHNNTSTHYIQMIHLSTLHFKHARQALKLYYQTIDFFVMSIII